MLGDVVGDAVVGDLVGALVGDVVGALVGALVGPLVGALVGDLVMRLGAARARQNSDPKIKSQGRNTKFTTALKVLTGSGANRTRCGAEAYLKKFGLCMSPLSLLHSMEKGNSRIQARELLAHNSTENNRENK